MGSARIPSEEKNGSLRLCIDYRQLNAVTIRDSFPIPRMDELLQALAGKKWFTTLDLSSSYWQIEVDPKQTVTRQPLYSRLGCTNSPPCRWVLPTQQRHGKESCKKCSTGCWANTALYIVFGKTQEEMPEENTYTLDKRH